MGTLVAGSTTAVWIALMAITGASWWLGTSPGSSGSSVAILAMALFKARLVIVHFMEVGSAPLPLRLACEAWVLGTGGLLIGFDVLA